MARPSETRRCSGCLQPVEIEQVGAGDLVENLGIVGPQLALRLQFLARFGGLAFAQKQQGLAQRAGLFRQGIYRRGLPLPGERFGPAGILLLCPLPPTLSNREFASIRQYFTTTAPRQVFVLEIVVVNEYIEKVAGTLQREIRQTKAIALLEEEASLNIVRTADLLMRRVAELFRPHNLSPAQYNVLRILRGAGKEGASCKDIGERLLARDPDITRLMDRLEAPGPCGARPREGRPPRSHTLSDQGGPRPGQRVRPAHARNCTAA